MRSWTVLDPRPAVVRSLRELTDGQRWTVGIALVVTVLFLAFGTRRAPETLGPFAAAGSTPPPVAVVAPPGPAQPRDADPAPVPARPAAVSSRSGGVPAAPPPEAPRSDDAEADAPTVLAVVRAGDGAVRGRDDAAIAAVFITDLEGARLAELEDAEGAVCAADGPTVVIAGEGLPDALHECALKRGVVVVSHDDRGSAGTSLSTALGAEAALVEAAGAGDGAVGLVVQQAHAGQAAAAREALEAGGRQVEVVVLGDDDAPPVGEMLDLLRAEVQTVVLAAPVATQDRWLSLAQTLRMPFEHVVADVADSIVDEAYTAATDGLRAVAATRVAWFARDHAETDAQRRCRSRFEEAVGGEVASAGELARVYQWCQHVALAAAVVAAGGGADAELDADVLDSPLTSPLSASTATGFGPVAVATLDWVSACGCWQEAVPYTSRRGPS